MNTRISPGQWFTSSNQEVVRIISYKVPHVRYAQASYGGTVCKTTDRAFLEHYSPITEDRATQLLRGPEQSTASPKAITIPKGVVEDSWFSAEQHLKRLAIVKPGEIQFGAVKSDLIAARERIEQGNASSAVLHMKWAIEKLLPEGQQYCSQTLADDDPEKTIQGYLDNIVQAVSAAKIQAKTPKPDHPLIDDIYSDLTACRTCGKPILVTANQCVHCSDFQ